MSEYGDGRYYNDVGDDFYGRLPLFYLFFEAKDIRKYCLQIYNNISPERILAVDELYITKWILDPSLPVKDLALLSLVLKARP